MSVFISCLKINCCLCNDASVIPEIASSLKLVFGWLWLVFILCKCNSGCSGEMSMSKNVFIWLNHSVINWIAHTHFAICHVADLYPLKLVFSDIEASEGLWSLRTLYIIVWCCFCPFLLYLDPSTSSAFCWKWLWGQFTVCFFLIILSIATAFETNYTRGFFICLFLHKHTLRNFRIVPVKKTTLNERNKLHCHVVPYWEETWTLSYHPVCIPLAGSYTVWLLILKFLSRSVI